MKNLKEWKTTVIGGMLFLLSFAYFAVNFKSLAELTWGDVMIPVGIGIAGILLSLAPDKVLNFAFGWLGKKADKE